MKRLELLQSYRRKGEMEEVLQSGMMSILLLGTFLTSIQDLASLQTNSAEISEA
jgi:hypothetical protein